MKRSSDGGGVRKKCKKRCCLAVRCDSIEDRMKRVTKNDGIDLKHSGRFEKEDCNLKLTSVSLKNNSAFNPINISHIPSNYKLPLRPHETKMLSNLNEEKVGKNELVGSKRFCGHELSGYIDGLKPQN